MKLEVFYDYSCPYCVDGHRMLTEILLEFPEVEVEWRPCEAHPRPESHGLHSDLCARGMYQIIKQGGDLSAYHEKMYQIACTDQQNIEDLAVIADSVQDLVDRTSFYDDLMNGDFQTKLNDNNQEAWLVEDFPAVPSLRMNGQTLKAIPNVGLTIENIRNFLKN